MARRITSAREQVAMLLPWRRAALQQRPGRPGETPPDYRELWDRPVGLSHDFDPFDDLGPHEVGRTAERAENFEWERGFDGGGDWELTTRNPDGNPIIVDTEPARGQRSQG